MKNNFFFFFVFLKFYLFFLKLVVQFNFWRIGILSNCQSYVINTIPNRIYELRIRSVNFILMIYELTKIYGMEKRLYFNMMLFGFKKKKEKKKNK